MWATVFEAIFLIYTSPGAVRMPSILAILTRLIVELPFAVRVEDGTPVSTEVLQMAHNSGSKAIAERRIKKFQCAGALMINLPLSKGPWFIAEFQHIMSRLTKFMLMPALNNHYSYSALYIMQCWP